jgi:hypothetical protein
MLAEAEDDNLEERHLQKAHSRTAHLLSPSKEENAKSVLIVWTLI